MKRYLALPAAIFLSLAVVAPSAVAAPRKASHGHAVSASHTVSFYATVVSAGRRGLVVRTSSGQKVRFSAAQLRRYRKSLAKAGRRHGRHQRIGPARQLAHAAIDPPAARGPSAINILALQPGAIVLISETVNHRAGVVVTVRLPPTNITVQETATGVVTGVQHGAFDVNAAGTELRLRLPQRLLTSLGLKTCDSVMVGYHQQAELLVADRVQLTSTSKTATCTSFHPSANHLVADAVDDQMGNR